MTRPRACLISEFGSELRLARKTHRAAVSGASSTTATALIDWKKLAGTVAPSRLRLVCSAAKKVSDAPACSNAAQKKTTKKAETKMTRIRSRSTLVSEESVITISDMAMVVE